MRQNRTREVRRERQKKSRGGVPIIHRSSSHKVQSPQEGKTSNHHMNEAVPFKTENVIYLCPTWIGRSGNVSPEYEDTHRKNTPKRMKVKTETFLGE